MDRDHFYITLFSNASQNLYPSNTIAAFTTHLAHSIELGSNDKWEVGVAEITYSPTLVGTFKPSTVVGDTISLMYCDLITPQFIGGSLARVIKIFTTPTINGKHYFDTVFYVPVEKKTFHDIRIEVVDMKGERIQFKSGAIPMQVILHFRRVTSYKI